MCNNEVINEQEVYNEEEEQKYYELKSKFTDKYAFNIREEIIQYMVEHNYKNFKEMGLNNLQIEVFNQSVIIHSKYISIDDILNNIKNGKISVYAKNEEELGKKFFEEWRSIKENEDTMYEIRYALGKISYDITYNFNIDYKKTGESLLGHSNNNLGYNALFYKLDYSGYIVREVF